MDAIYIGTIVIFLGITCAFALGCEGLGRLGERP